MSRLLLLDHCLQLIGLILMSRLLLLDQCLMVLDLAFGSHNVSIALQQLSLVLNSLLPKLRCCLA